MRAVKMKCFFDGPCEARAGLWILQTVGREKPNHRDSLPRNRQMARKVRTDPVLSGSELRSKKNSSHWSCAFSSMLSYGINQDLAGL